MTDPRFAVLDLPEPVELDDDDLPRCSSPSMPVDVAGEPECAGFFISVGLSIPVGLVCWSVIWSVL